MGLFQCSCFCLVMPLLGAIFSYISAYNNYKIDIWFCVASVLLSFFSSCYFFYCFVDTQLIDTIHFFTWIRTETIQIDWGARFDSLSTVMLLIVTLISLLVHIYSVGYMREDENKLIFFGHLNLFTFMMIFLVVAPNMLQLFCGWEGVSFVSYLLINYWNGKPSAVSASIKAFSVNRISDVGLILACGAIFTLFHTLDFDNLFQLLKEPTFAHNSWWLNAVSLFLIFGAMGKSGQLGLHIWLPDAMEAPTPVSALLHAATMVTAGVFLIIRFAPLFELAFFARQVMMFVGVITGILTGIIALAQNDIKKIIAYSTCSQLGFMFMACAAGAYSAAFFHLFTHAFFKALIFLCAGNVIHAMSHEQSIIKMGGLKTYLPSSYYCMLVGVASLVGLPFTSGFYSKESIIELIYRSHIPFGFLYFIASLLITFITGLYAWRMLFLVFHGKVNADEHVVAHIHKIEKVMLYPVAILAFFSIIMGYVGFELLIKQSLGFFWDNSITSQIFEYKSWWVKSSILIAGFMAFSLSYFIYLVNPKVIISIIKIYPKVYQILKEKLYIDEFYSQKIVSPLFMVGFFLYQFGDRKIIDRFGSEGIAKLAFKMGESVRNLQSGYLFYYIFMTALGVTIILTLYLLIHSYPIIKRLSFMAGYL